MITYSQDKSLLNLSYKKLKNWYNIYISCGYNVTIKSCMNLNGI